MSAKPLTQAELHNQLAPELSARIVRAPLTTGGDVTDVCVLMESVLVGVAQTLEAAGLAKPEVLAMICENAKRRHTQLHLLANAKGTPQ
ncbi:hypothetical protein [Aureimonas sp. SK2]|uniref:hypothetical protein n=1 Tax=Aureimonas sp. SK2 TaxID=3015992 RepID=UPI002444C3B0|nr:hypothetical protein [Aureimonas sp. SK2]